VYYCRPSMLVIQSLPARERAFPPPPPARRPKEPSSGRANALGRRAIAHEKLHVSVGQGPAADRRRRSTYAGLDVLAEAAGMSPSTPSCVLQNVTGVTPRLRVPLTALDGIRDEFSRTDTVTKAIYGARFIRVAVLRHGFGGARMTRTDFSAPCGDGTSIRFAWGSARWARSLLRPPE